MFGSQALRMLRETWRSATELAEELYAIFANDKLPLEHSGPITLDKPDGTQAPITLRGFKSGDTVLTINRTPDAPINITLGNPNPDGTIPLGGLAGQSQQQQTPTNTFTGTVLSGSGATYSVRLGIGQTVNVTQLQINSDDIIPAGTRVLVVKEAGVFKMVVPVWL